MKRPLIIAVSLLAVSAIAAGSALTVFRSKPPGIPAPVPTAVSATPEPPAELTQWNDQAGFSFSYPKTLTVDRHDEDKDNYAHIEFTDPKHPGTLVIWAKDTRAADAESWVKAERDLSGGVVIDTKLGSLDAKKVMLASDSGKRVVLGTVSDNIVFYLDARLTDGAYWQQVLDAVSGSFVFTPAPGDETGGGAQEQEQPADEEEEITYLGRGLA